MKRTLQAFFAGIAGAAVLATAFLPQWAPSAHAEARDWHLKSVSVVSRYADDFASEGFKQSVRNAKENGITHVTLIIPYYQSDYKSSDIAPGPSTPSAQVLGQAIDFIHSEGLKVVLKPHLELWNAGWRGNIEATNRDEWYQRYGEMLGRIADVGHEHEADMMVIGTELIGMASPYVNWDNTQRWRTMIADVRSRYSGLLTYSGNWGRGTNYLNEFEQIAFWDDLDYIGISAYFDLNQDWNNNSVQSFKEEWQRIDQNQVEPLQQRFNKPVLFTEVGYKSTDGAHTMPWEYNLNGNYNAQEQVNLYQALLEYWNGRPYFDGASLWDWSSDPNVGGQGDTSYTFHNKPAESTVREWFTRTDSGGGDGGNGGNGGNGTSTPPSGEWSVTSPAISGAQTGSSLSIPVTVSTTGGSSNAIVDIEVYDQGGARVFQQFFEGQTLSSASPSAYTVSWTPSQAGTYRLKTGLFSSGWASNFYWNDQVQEFAVSTPSQNPPTDPGGNPGGGSYQTDIWWPSNGAAVSGVQPFKVMLQNIAVSDYKTYWQVDGGSLVEMYDSDVDYPHKEFMVDLSGWGWKGEGPYTITFVSKDLSGNTISERSVDIYVR